MFPIIDFFGKTIGTYGLCAAIGMVAAGGVATALGKRFKLAFEDIVMLMLSIMGGLLIGGHLIYGLTNIKIIIQILGNVGKAAPMDILKGLAICFGGMVYYGGFLGAIAAVFIHTRFSKVGWQRSAALDIFAVSVPLFHTFGRIGCFFGGCCYGKESSFGFITYSNTINPSINGVVRLPVQLFEAGCNLAIFLFLLMLFLGRKQEGKLILWYMLIYPVVRFLLEFLRGDVVRGAMLGLSTSQWLSILIFLVAVICLLCGKRKASSLESSPEVQKG